MRVRRSDGSLLAVNDVVPLAERLGLVRLLDHRVLELVLNELAAAPGLRRPSIRIGWRRSVPRCAQIRASPSVS
jgi:EAL domain-containing protein (putative c-di-GMP-specific phosphodiesterase class I)